MAHNLAKNSKTGDAAFFAIEPAWHGLGIILEKPATAAEAIKFAGLDFDVLQKPVMFNQGTDAAPLYTKVGGKLVNYRSDNNIPLGVVGSVYTPLQNREAFTFFDNLVGTEEAIYHAAGALGEGERIWILAKMPSYIRVGKDDLTEMYVLLSNSHNGTSGVTACFTPIRVVCQNTLSAALGTTKNKISIPHTTNVVANMKKAHELLNLSSKYATDMEAAFQAMAAKKVNQKDVDLFLDLVYPIKEENQTRTAGVKLREGILEAIASGVGQDLDSTKGTAFGLYNGFTYYFDHQKDFDSTESRFKSSLFGGGAERKRQEAFNAALQLIKA